MSYLLSQGMAGLRHVILLKYMAHSMVAEAWLTFLSTCLQAIYVVVLYHAALRVINEHYAMLATAGLVLNYVLTNVRSEATSPQSPMYRSDNVLAELPISPLTIFRLGWLLTAATSGALTLVNFTILRLALPPQHVGAWQLQILPLSALTSPSVSLFMNLQWSLQWYAISTLSLSLSRRLRVLSYALLQRILSRLMLILSFSLSSAVPVYYTLASMPWWAKPLALVNPQTFLIEAGRGELDVAEAAAALLTSCCLYYAANEFLFRRAVMRGPPP